MAWALGHIVTAMFMLVATNSGHVLIISVVCAQDQAND